MHCATRFLSTFFSYSHPRWKVLVLSRIYKIKRKNAPLSLPFSSSTDLLEFSAKRDVSIQKRDRYGCDQGDRADTIVSEIYLG